MVFVPSSYGGGPQTPRGSLRSGPSYAAAVLWVVSVANAFLQLFEDLRPKGLAVRGRFDRHCFHAVRAGDSVEDVIRYVNNGKAPSGSQPPYASVRTRYESHTVVLRKPNKNQTPLKKRHVAR
jgi:hypothetical protein